MTWARGGTLVYKSLDHSCFLSVTWAWLNSICHSHECQVSSVQTQPKLHARPLSTPSHVTRQWLLSFVPNNITSSYLIHIHFLNCNTGYLLKHLLEAFTSARGLFTNDSPGGTGSQLAGTLFTGYLLGISYVGSVGVVPVWSSP